MLQHHHIGCHCAKLTHGNDNILDNKCPGNFVVEISRNVYSIQGVLNALKNLNSIDINDMN